MIEEGVRAYEKQLERAERGEIPLYRPKGYEEEERIRKKMRSKSSWCKPFDTVVFIPPTPDGELAKRIRKVAKELGKDEIKVKVVEEAGKKLRTILPGMTKETNCGRVDCLMHSMGSRGDCNVEGVVYRGTCKLCATNGKSAIYIGESGRSMYTRGKEHLIVIKNPNNHKNNAFAKHSIEHHNSTETQYKIDIIKSYKKPLERQVREGVEIIRMQADTVMNSKMDHIQPGIRRIAFSDLYDEIEGDN